MATRIPQEFIDEVTSKTNIVDVISKYVQLKNLVRICLDFAHFMKNELLRFQLQRTSKFFIVLVVVVGVTSSSSLWRWRTNLFLKP
jgi:DNA primase (bacterial type)